MRRESGEVLLDRLIVADIRQYRIEYRHLGSVGGNWNAGLCHQSQQTDRFERYRFTTGVGAGDHQLTALGFELDADWNHLGSFEFKISFQQGMASVVQKQASFARPGQPRAAVPTLVLLACDRRAQLRGHAVVIFGEVGFGKLHLQLTKDRLRREDGLRLLADAPSHLQQDAVNLRQFFVEQPYQFIVLFNRLQGLDEYGLAARTGSVHDALHAAFLLNLYGDDKAFPTDGD